MTLTLLIPPPDRIIIYTPARDQGYIHEKDAIPLFKLDEHLEWTVLCGATACDYQHRGTGSIPGYTLEIFLGVKGLEWGSFRPMKTVGEVLDTSKEIRLRIFKLRLRDNTFLTRSPPSLPFPATASVILCSSELWRHELDLYMQNISSFWPKLKRIYRSGNPSSYFVKK